MIQKSLEKILQTDSSQKDCKDEEDCIKLYVDTIQVSREETDQQPLHPRAVGSLFIV